MTTVRAPGKAMLFGEYAVLDGAPALVAAVDRYVVVTDTDDGQLPDSPFVRAALAARARHLVGGGVGPHPGLRIDSTALTAEGAAGRKLGLGSSAAVTVAVVGPQPALARSQLFSICAEAHAQAQGGSGSGADVAAAVWGGVLSFQRRDGQTTVTPLQWSRDVALTFVDTGVAASTSERLARLAALRQSDPTRALSLSARLCQIASNFSLAVQGGAPPPIAEVEAWNVALDALEEALELPIRTAAHRAIADLARAVGGAAKPSGAGGGDLAVCFTSRDASLALRRHLAEQGFAVLDLAVGARGVHSLDSAAAAA